MTDKIGMLQRELDETQAQIAALEAAWQDKLDYGQGSEALAVTRWELNRAMVLRLREQAASLEQTLSQAGEAPCGICERCGKSIHPDRLAVLPQTPICVRCAQDGEGQATAPRQGVPEAESRT